MKKLVIICGVALLLAAVFSVAVRPVPIEQKLIQIQAGDRLKEFPGIEEEPLRVQAILLDLADDPLLRVKAQAAFIRYPNMARGVFSLYGAEPEFQDILRRYGETVLPPIHHFMTRPIYSIELINKADQGYQALKQFFTGAAKSADAPEAPSSQYQALSSQQRGWFAVNFIKQEGHDFLGQFVVDDQGETQWVMTERMLEGLNQFFTSGIRSLETKYRAGEEVTAGDFGWASVDVLVLTSAVKVLNMGRAAAVTTQSASRATRSAALAARVSQGGRMVLSSARYAKWPLFIGAGYLVMTHPSLISDVLAGVAKVLGYPVLAVQFAGWLLLLIPLLYLGSWLLWLFGPLLMGVLRVAHFILARLSGRARRAYVGVGVGGSSSALLRERGR
ncbi:hypothetical protein GCM10011502_00690 [Oceanisphaera marina]|uniref:Uncharacterized protein n=1 Tax=Oceanisphaera marina TaxID=2017550 RepID=A0ABQ1IA89_9GAMM|nr:hypothetical protein [Oceanisphaera marina]GGB31587.1 hypothetical protein GCM10011502_00690 [Oceanisphaera marina]